MAWLADLYSFTIRTSLMILITLVSLPALEPSLAPLLALARETVSDCYFPSVGTPVSLFSSEPEIQFMNISISVSSEAVLTRSSQKKKEFR